MTDAKTYDWTQFTLKIMVAAPADKVFQAWTDDKVITKWFPVKATIEPVKGGRIYLEWLGGDKLDDKIIEIRKHQSFVFPFGTKGEQVSIKFIKVKGGTVVELHQSKMKTTPQDKVQMHLGCIQGWTFFLANLKSFLEKKYDLRGHDINRSYRQGYINS